MNENLHVILFHPYDVVKDLCQEWASKCQTFAVAEHPAEGNTQRIHCHVLIIEPTVKREALDRAKRKLFPTWKGTTDSKIMTSVQSSKDPISRQGLWYLMKGQKDRLKFYKNFSELEVEEALKYFDPGQAKRESQLKKSEKIKQKSLWDITSDIRSEMIEKDLITSYDYQEHTCQFPNPYDKNIKLIIVKHLEINKRLVSMYDIEKILVSLMKLNTDAPFWTKLFSKLDL